jgi:hypothetical protein
VIAIQLQFTIPLTADEIRALNDECSSWYLLNHPYEELAAQRARRGVPTTGPILSSLSGACHPEPSRGG